MAAIDSGISGRRHGKKPRHGRPAADAEFLFASRPRLQFILESKGRFDALI